MRPGSRTIALIALAAFIGMAFVGTSSATAEATALCKADETKCSAGNTLTHIHETTLSGHKAVLKTSILTVECDVLFLGDTVAGTSTPLIVEGNLTYTNCGGCTAKEVNGPVALEILRLGHETSDVTGEGEVHVECSGLNCTYNGENLLGTGKGPLLSSETNGEVKLNEVETHKVSGLLCPSTSKLTITTTPLTATYLGGLSAASTSISTSLKGGGKEGTEITVTEGTKVKDTATLSGTNASSATGTVDYSVYKDKECKELVTKAGEVTVKEGKVPDSEEKELEGGAVYYWQAQYLGDTMNLSSTSTCSKEVLTVEEKFTPHKTTLCTSDDAGRTCLEEHNLGTADFKDSAVEFLTSLVSSKCEGLISGSVGAAGEPQKVTGEYKFSSCTNGCVVTEISGGSKLGFIFETSKKSTEELATATTEGLELFYKCGETVKCAYGSIKAVGDVLGALKTGDNGHITFSKDSLGGGEGLLCPKEATLDALFVSSNPIYIREGPPTSLCSKDEGSSTCKAENRLKTIDYKDKALELLTSLGNVKCEGLASGSVGEPGIALEVKPELSFSGCSEGCFVTVVSGPGKVVLERTKSEEAKATAEGFEIFVKCGTTIKCLLGPEKLAGTALGALASGDNGRLTFSKAPLGKGEGAACPKEATLDATYVASSATYIG